MKKLVQAAGLVLSFSAGSALAQEDLIGGRPVGEGEFSEIVHIRSGASHCSATVIGPRVILTAAHCLESSSEIGPVNFTFGQKTFHALCQASPDYKNPAENHDMALCKTDVDMEGIRYAAVSTEPVALKEEVILSGYGCTDVGGAAGSDGLLRIGFVEVTELPQAGIPWFQTKGQAALCFGDSGGPSFSALGNTKDIHRVVGVNSMGNIRDLSLMTALSIDKSKDFMNDFEKSEGVAICGLSLSCD
ncbi:MAG: trypsin-like serine protease [Oligoflexales bacterium]|nr:trypsin-like serine protease [Oligoflexales bacterium]